MHVGGMTQGYAIKVRLVLVSLAHLIETMHKICKDRGSNPDHHQKKNQGWVEGVTRNNIPL